MAPVLHLGDRAIDSTELLPLLVQYQLLPHLMRELVLDRAIIPITLTDEERSHAYAHFDAVHHLDGEDARYAWIQERGIPPTQSDAMITRPLRIEKFKVFTWGNRLEAIFLGQKANHDQVTYSLLRTPDPEVAQELFFRIKAGEESFAELAREYSQGPEAATDGVIGPVPMSQPHPALAEKLRHCQPGQLLSPTRMGEWYVLLRLDAITPACLNDAMRQTLLDDCFETWLQDQMRQVRLAPSPTPSLALA